MMTDEEKKELKKLSVDDLIGVIDELRDSAAKQIEAEKRAIVSRFIGGSGKIAESEVQDISDEPTLDEIPAFQRLKKRFS